jgi:multiple sugar transport system permease protein
MYGQGQQELALGMGGDSANLVGAIPTKGNQVMAGALLTILPMLLLYLFTQRYFVESVERAGIAGE